MSVGKETHNVGTDIVGAVPPQPVQVSTVERLH